MNATRRDRTPIPEGQGMKDWQASAAALHDGRLQRMVIDGAWCEARTGAVIEARNPADGTLLGTVPRGDAADIDAAVTAARRAFDGPWSRVTPFERQALLLRIADLIEAEWDDLCLSDTLDMGMPIRRTLANSRRVLGMLRFYAGQAVTIHGETIRNSLRDGGYLMIGMTETLPTQSRDGFEPVYKQQRIYRRS